MAQRRSFSPVTQPPKVLTVVSPQPALSIGGVSTFPSNAAVNAKIATLSEPFGAGSTYAATETAAGQLAVSNGAVVRGMLAASDQVTYAIKVRATSADGKREIAETFVFTCVAPVGWGLGLDFVPDYVTNWVRPATIAAGKANGSIPADAIEFETGNAGGPFAFDATGVGLWIDACNAAGKAGAIQTNLTALGSLGRKYAPKGLYGAGSANVKIKRTDRAGSSPANRRNWLHVGKDDVTIRGIDFDSFVCVIGVTSQGLPLVNSSVVEAYPYHRTTNEPVREMMNSNAGGLAVGLHVLQIGNLKITGSVNITAVDIKRQIKAIDATGTTYGEKFDDAAWYATLETISLFSGQSATTHTQLQDAIIAGGAANGYTAELKADGSVRLVPIDANTRAPLEIIVTYTGSGTVYTDTKTPTVDMSFCTFTDCDHGYAALLDVLTLGDTRIFKNDAVGTYSLLSAPVTRWMSVRFACNYWHDCMQSRPAATGRTDSRLPSGSSQSARNTLCQLGTDSSVMMRYHGKDGGNECLFDNNRVEYVESANNTNTVNAAVLADVRNGWQVTANNRLIRFAYNYVKNLLSRLGAEDCNVFYGKLRGFTYLCNYMEDFGAEFISTGTLDGAECNGILIKNPGNNSWQPSVGVAAVGGGVYPEVGRILGNTFINPGRGHACIKVDEFYTVEIDYNLFRNWTNVMGSTENGSGSAAGLIRLTNHMLGAKVRGNRFENVGWVTNSAQLVSMWDIDPFVGASFASVNFEFHNNELVNDGTTSFPIPTGDIAFFTFNFGSSAQGATFIQNMKTGFNDIANVDGTTFSGFKLLVRIYQSANYAGNLLATSAKRSTKNFLQAFGNITG